MTESIVLLFINSFRSPGSLRVVQQGTYDNHLTIRSTKRSALGSTAASFVEAGRRAARGNFPTPGSKQGVHLGQKYPSCGFSDVRGQHGIKNRPIPVIPFKIRHLRTNSDASRPMPQGGLSAVEGDGWSAAEFNPAPAYDSDYRQLGRTPPQSCPSRRIGLAEPAAAASRSPRRKWRG
jgi:hypothetical protein